MVFRAICIFVLTLLAAFATEAQEPVYDIRVLIDTSGSMKKNDPFNLRIPSLKLLVNLLPASSRVGIWLFDSKPELLFPPELVDEAQKSSILKSTKKIHSRGLFTHIEAALDAAVQDWYGVPLGSQHRGIILLTDGMVDISKDASVSEASRQRLLAELLPKIQMTGAEVHTIGLSEQSDRELLRQISLASGGGYEIALNAEDLRRSFLHIFNKAVPQNTLPIQDNQFNVDASIEEFTVLVLLSPAAKPTHLLGPDASDISQEHTPAQARWVHEQGYDLVTVSHPAPGTWKLIADVDPSNQVLIVTHLQMNLTPLPNFLMRNEMSNISATFTEHGQLITRQDFLNLLKVEAELANSEGKQMLAMPQESTPSARFTLHLNPGLETGSYTLTVMADGKTFQRQAMQTFQLLDDWVKVETQVDSSAHPSQVIVTLTPNPQSLLADSLVIKATLTDSTGHTQELTAEHHEANWQIRFPELGPEEHGVINFKIAAKTLDGKNIEVPMKPLTISGRKPDSSPPQEAHQSQAPPASFSQTDWFLTGGMTLGINIVLSLLWFITYRQLKKRQEALIASLLNKLSPSEILL
jgi:uncharacterized protein (TIGR03503 family)